MDNLRKQVQLFQERLARMEALGHNEPHHVSKHDALSPA